jgi:23S rRNA (uracil1939-C5)-methyltransferase
VADARDSVERRGLDNVTLLEGDAGANLKALLPGSMDALVVDPPRSGCSPEVLRQLARIKARRVVYVSCDPATLARDLRFLLDHGYELEVVQPFDLFPQTAHIECVAVLKLPRKYRPRK